MTAIRTRRELDALPAGSVVLDVLGDAFQMGEDGLWAGTDGSVCTSADLLSDEGRPDDELYVTLLHRPDDQPYKTPADEQEVIAAAAARIVEHARDHAPDDAHNSEVYAGDVIRDVLARDRFGRATLRSTTQWGVRWTGTHVVDGPVSEHLARTVVKENEGRALVTREAFSEPEPTPWREVLG